MDTLFGFVAPLLPNLVALLCTNLEGKRAILQRKIGALRARKEDVSDQIRRHPGKNPKREVEDWRNNVENIIKDFETLEQRVQQSKFYHVFKRANLAEQLESMTVEATELVAQSEFRGGLFLEVDEIIDISLIPPPDDQTFRQNVDAIWTSLMDPNVVSIGIYGMGGVGKTTLARCVHDKLLKESTFSRRVYWVTVSQEFRIYKLQSDIAQLLKLDITDENEEGRRAAKLHQVFQKMERFVLILDDVWKPIDAEEIGIIPSEKDGCQLVITSRSEGVCRSMCCKKIIKVKTLSEQEALNLFSKTLDRDDKLSAEVEDICKKMVSRCDGLPLALITLAGSMRSVIDIHEWRYALEGLKESCLARADMEDKVLPILLNSYHRLRDTTLQNCFLYCSLYPEDFIISRKELIGDFISEELMERKSSWKAEVDQGHAILNQLVRACLLESDSDGDLKMHDLIREMAIRITKEKPRYMVKAGLHLKELPEEQEWTEDLDKVYLMRNSIKKISPGTSPKCPSLSTLILRSNPLQSIPDCFFTHMRGLRTLNLSGTDIMSLPNSISDLEKLNALLLARCTKLVSVPSLEKLKVLKHLDLTGARIGRIPRGMESLTNLKRLSLSCRRLEMIPTGTLHRLTHLQQLELPYYFEVPIEEVEALKQLELLECRLNSVRDLNRLINSRQSDKKFHSYNITLRSRKCEEQWPLDFSRRRSKSLSFGVNSLYTDTDGNMLPQDVETLHFFHSGLLDEFPIPNSVRECKIYDEDKIECIMRLEEEFQNLEELYLIDLPNLIGLFKWDIYVPLPPGTFSCLKELRIEHCGKIKKLFPQCLVHNFHDLRILRVSACEQMEEIIEDDNNEGADITLPMLKELTLASLPQLKSICKGKMICDDIEEISLRDIKNIKKLPLYLPFLHGQLSPPTRLRKINIGDGDREWWESLEWPHHNANNVLQPLVHFYDPRGVDIMFEVCSSLKIKNLLRRKNKAK